MYTLRAKSRQLVLGFIAALVLALSASPAYALFDKTRFVADLGLGFFAFHHWILKPYQEGKFAAGSPGRVGAIAKGALAALFVLREVRAAEKIAHTSKDPLLQKLDASLAGLSGSFTSLGQKFKAGQVDENAISSVNDSTTSLSTSAASGGLAIKDLPVKVPGL